MTAKTQIGLLITDNIRHGTPEISVRVIGVDAGKEYPRNLSGEYDDFPGLSGLGMRFYVSDYDGHIASSDPQYEDSYYLNESDLRRMVKAVAKANRAIAADQSREHGDLFASFARGVGASFAIIRLGEFHASTYADNDYRRMTLAEGRNLLREKLAKMEADAIASGKVRHLRLIAG